MKDKGSGNKPYLTPFLTGLLAIGSSVGWGSFVMTGTLFLPTAGAYGTIIGLFAGAAVMFLIAKNYQYMMDIYPEAGGTYAFARNVLGYDYGFLVSWFLSLAYISILWANATSLELFSRFLFGSFFEFGPHYTVTGFEVYLSEILVISGIIFLFAWIHLPGF